MKLSEAKEGEELIITKIKTNDKALESFLFSLGCYSGEVITVISQRKNCCIICVKGVRYSLDKNLASVIFVG